MVSGAPAPSMPIDRPDVVMTHPIADARYVSFTTFRRNGTPVATLVWIALLGDGRSAS